MVPLLSSAVWNTLNSAVVTYCVGAICCVVFVSLCGVCNKLDVGYLT